MLEILLANKLNWTIKKIVVSCHNSQFQVTLNIFTRWTLVPWKTTENFFLSISQKDSVENVKCESIQIPEVIQI